MSAILNPSAQETELEANLDHTVRLCLKTDQTNTKPSKVLLSASLSRMPTLAELRALSKREHSTPRPSAWTASLQKGFVDPCFILFHVFSCYRLLGFHGDPLSVAV